MDFKSDHGFARVVGIHGHVLRYFSAPVAGIQTHFYPPLAAGGDLLVRKENSGAASPGVYFVDAQGSASPVCEYKRVLQHGFSGRGPEIVLSFGEHRAGLVTTGKEGGQGGRAKYRTKRDVSKSCVSRLHMPLKYIAFVTITYQRARRKSSLF
jgi:hypothetical protein